MTAAHQTLIEGAIALFFLFVLWLAIVVIQTKRETSRDLKEFKDEINRLKDKERPVPMHPYKEQQ